jgi:extracellular factor (EF) 3-hydroxypalmitic acid methyl ester biosynthesis protein
LTEKTEKQKNYIFKPFNSFTVSRMNQSVVEIGYILMDETQEMILDGDINGGMNHLFMGLQHIRNNHNHQEWKKFAQNQFLAHPLKTLIHQDPFTRHAFEKPRGYPGDAELLDYIYGFQEISHNISNLGNQIHLYCIDIPGSRSVRARRDILANTIDEVAKNSINPPRVLSIACGHLREAKKSLAFQEKQIRELIALDQDLLSLEVIKRKMRDYPITTVCGSIRQLLNKKLVFDNLDFVYAAGLYDYLSLALASRLTRIMFDMLKSGGTLLIANFMPSLPDIGYLETFMQWFLIYRNQADFEQVANEIPAERIEHKEFFMDKHENINFLKISKN